jgi:hypothetical protein
MRRQIGSRLRLRRVPEFEFRFDESIEHQDRIEQIIRDLHEHPPEPLTPEPVAAPEGPDTTAAPPPAHDRDDT